MQELISANTEKILKLKESLDLFVNKNAKVVIRSKADLEAAAEIRNIGRKALKDVEVERKIALEPFDNGRDIIQALAKQITTPIKSLVDALDEKMIAYTQAETKRIEAQNEKILAKAIEQNKPVETIKLKETTKVEGFTVIDNWKTRIVNALIIPDVYMMKVPNIEMLNALAKSSSGKAQVDGVEFINDQHTSGRIK